MQFRDPFSFRRQTCCRINLRHPFILPMMNEPITKFGIFIGCMIQNKLLQYPRFDWTRSWLDSARPRSPWDPEASIDKGLRNSELLQQDYLSLSSFRPRRKASMGLFRIFSTSWTRRLACYLAFKAESHLLPVVSGFLQVEDKLRFLGRRVAWASAPWSRSSWSTKSLVSSFFSVNIIHSIATSITAYRPHSHFTDAE